MFTLKHPLLRAVRLLVLGGVLLSACAPPAREASVADQPPATALASVDNAVATATSAPTDVPRAAEIGAQPAAGSPAAGLPAAELPATNTPTGVPTRTRPTSTPRATRTPAAPTPPASAAIDAVATLPVLVQSVPTPLPSATAPAAREENPVYPASLQPLVDLILADLEARTGSPRSALRLAAFEGVTWNDGSLGCPQPGVMYTQALVPGYRFVFALGDRQYNYHTNRSTTFVYCEKPLGSPQPNPDQ